MCIHSARALTTWAYLRPSESDIREPGCARVCVRVCTCVRGVCVNKTVY